LRIEAKSIIRAHKNGDVRCCETLRHHNRFAHTNDDEILKAKVSLQEAQHALSLEYGFENWTDLAEQVVSNGKNGDSQKEALKQIETLQTSEDESQQSHAIHVLGMLGDDGALPHIAPFIESPSEELRWVAVRSTIRLMGDKSRPLVYHHLVENAESDRIKVEIAGYFGHSEADALSIEYLMTAFQNEGLRRLAAYKLLDLRSDVAIPFIRDELRSGSRPIRYKSLTMLRNSEYPERIDDWQWILDNEPVDKIRIKAIEIIARNRIKGLSQRLEQAAAQDSSEEVRQAATTALKAMQE